MGITRKQLHDFGITDYLVKRLTKALKPRVLKGRAYEYNIQQVLDSIRSLMSTPKVRRTTKAVLACLEVKVIFLVENAMNDERLLASKISGGGLPPKLCVAMRCAGVANARFDETARVARKVAKEFQDHKKERGLNFSSRNNIVTFTS